MTTTLSVTARQRGLTATVILDLVHTSDHNLSYDELYEELQTIAQACQNEPGVERLTVEKEHGTIIIDFEGDALPPVMRRAISYVDVKPLNVSTARFQVQDR